MGSVWGTGKDEKNNKSIYFNAISLCAWRRFPPSLSLSLSFLYLYVSIFFSASSYFLILGRHISCLPRHLAFLGTSHGTFPSGHLGLLWFLRWCRCWFTLVRPTRRCCGLPGTLLCVRHIWSYLVFVLDLAVLWESTQTSCNQHTRVEVYWEIAGRVCTSIDAVIQDNSMAPNDAFDARVCHHCGQFLSLMELLSAGALPILVPQAQVRLQSGGGGLCGLAATSHYDHNCTLWRHVGGSSAQERHPIDDKCEEALQLRWLWHGGTLLSLRGAFLNGGECKGMWNGEWSI